MVKRILSILFVIILLGWLALVVTDFLRVRDNKEPKFCLSNKTVEHADNSKTEICTGLGYKVQKYYENGEHTATEIGPFFIKDKKAD